MSKEREEVLKNWEELLKEATKMLETARKRNNLLKESAEKEKIFRKQIGEFESFLGQVVSFQKEHNSLDCKSEILALCRKINQKQEEMEKEAAPYLRKFKEACTLAHRIERYKEYLSCFETVYQDLSLTKEEMCSYQGQLTEIMALILLTNENEISITEDNFFVSANDFYAILKENFEEDWVDLVRKEKLVNITSLDEFLDKL